MQIRKANRERRNRYKRMLHRASAASISETRAAARRGLWCPICTPWYLRRSSSPYASAGRPRRRTVTRIVANVRPARVPAGPAGHPSRRTCSSSQVTSAPTTPSASASATASTTTARRTRPSGSTAEFRRWLDRVYQRVDRVIGIWATTTSSVSSTCFGVEPPNLDMAFLNDETVEIDGSKIHGTPWCPALPRGRSTAARVPAARAEHPSDLDILIASHGPPYGTARLRRPAVRFPARG